MNTKEIHPKVLLASVKQPDIDFGLKYNMNLSVYVHQAGDQLVMLSIQPGG